MALNAAAVIILMHHRVYALHFAVRLRVSVSNSLLPPWIGQRVIRHLLVFPCHPKTSAFWMTVALVTPVSIVAAAR